MNQIVETFKAFLEHPVLGPLLIADVVFCLAWLILTIFFPKVKKEITRQAFIVLDTVAITLAGALPVALILCLVLLWIWK